MQACALQVLPRQSIKCSQFSVLRMRASAQESILAVQEEMEEQEELLNESIATSIRGKRQAADKAAPTAKRCVPSTLPYCGQRATLTRHACILRETAAEQCHQPLQHGHVWR